MSDQMDKLYKKWRKAKAKAEKFTAEESMLRWKINAVLEKNKQEKLVVDDGSESVEIKRKFNYSIPKPSILALKYQLKSSLFKKLFNVSYSLKVPVYEALDDVSKEKVDDVMTVKPGAPTVKISVK